MDIIVRRSCVSIGVATFVSHIKQSFSHIVFCYKKQLFWREVPLPLNKTKKSNMLLDMTTQSSRILLTLTDANCYGIFAAYLKQSLRQAEVE